MKRLAGKTALVFGAGPNIGGTIGYYLAKEGARVVFVDRDLHAASATAEFIRSRGHECLALQGDAINEPDVSTAVKSIVERYGRIDAVVNMAGTIHWSSIRDMEIKDWTECLVSFPTAGMLTTKHAANAMIEANQGGSIIHILSTAAHFGEASGAAYCASKAALLNLARSAAMDLAQYNIRVNTITPCSMEHQLWTLMKEQVFDPNFKPSNPQAFYSRDDYLKMIPLGRFCRSSDLASAAVFLASNEASFITGADIPVDGGLRHKYPTWRPGDHGMNNIVDYVSNARVIRYGEEAELLAEFGRGSAAESF